MDALVQHGNRKQAYCYCTTYIDTVTLGMESDMKRITIYMYILCFTFFSCRKKKMSLIYIQTCGTAPVDHGPPPPSNMVPIGKIRYPRW